MWPFLVFALLFVDAAVTETFVLGYLTGSQRRPGDKKYPRPGLTISGAITYAVDQVNRDLAHQGSPHRIEFKVAETFGDEEISIHEVAELWRANVSGYIGPQETCVHEARMASSFNLPMISYYCTQQETSNKKYFKTFARTRPSDTQISKSVTALLLYFEWDKVAFLYLDQEDGTTSKVAKTLLETFRNAGITILATRSWGTPHQFPYAQDTFRDIVENTYEHARIYVILGSHDEHLGLLSAMEERRLLTSGDYFVVGVNLEAYNQEDPTKYMKGLLREDIDPYIPDAFSSYLSILPSTSTAFNDFSLKVNEYMSKPPFNYPTWTGVNKVIPPEAGYLYDAVLLYVTGLQKVLEDNGDPRNGSAIINAIKGAHYLSGMGYMSYIDENGDAQGNYTLLAKRPHPTLPDAFGLYPIGVFISSDNDSALPGLELSDEMIWVKGYPPIAEPVCGFYGENCNFEKDTTMQKVFTVGGALLVVFLIASLVFYRNWRYEQELDSLLWKVDFKDIQISEHDNDTSVGTKMTRATHPLIRTSQVSLSSNPDADFRYSAIFTTIGVYKGRVFAIQKVRKKAIDITRAMKKELKMMRDIRHDNLNPFIGACTESPNICIVTEYCTRGSLKDILENDNVKLDNMFIASLVSDIVRGMTFLHESPVKYHGKLKTSNCLVDSRWVLKISEYGLHEFKKGSEELTDEASVARKLEGLLYRAPELLRLSGVDEEDIGSQKGDVYSFAIILYELHGRQGPFGETSLTNQEILDKVALPTDPVFRPPLEALENSFDFVRECLKECWAENPESRIDFKTIRTRLRPMKKGMKPNIFDNMMAMMEKYTNNLEALVDERTDQLMIEKKKTEALLYEMLPRPVAEQLKRGNKVEAENYDCVTIYFSDIVGFTAMSSESTPLQIVDFLNDLYTCFDSAVENYDVYKVETIGDAYMVVSGLPIRNGDEHAAEIASMSLHLLNSVKRFRIKHRPDEALKLRIGIHSGPVCAGVVGLKMPRYCLFGDTVNTASRMESTGIPGFIHCSSDTKALLDRLGGYHLEERGIVVMKGKGDQLTFWLTGEDPYRQKQRELKRSARKMSPNGPKNKVGPRSSLKNRNNDYLTRRSPLARCSSLESPKKLRFASVDLMEFQKFDLSKDPLLEVISDTSPKKNNLLDVHYNAEHVRRASSSCPCIENFDTSNNVPLSPVSQLLSINYYVNTSSSVPALVLPSNSPCKKGCNGNIHIYIDPDDENVNTPLLNQA